MEKIRVSKKEAFLAEFPWLHKYLPKEIAYIKVQRADLNLCRRNLNKVTIMVSLLPPVDVYWEKIFLLSFDGQKLGEVGQIKYPPKPKTFWRRNPKPFVKFNKEETIEAVLYRLGTRASEVHFVLSIDWINDNDRPVGTITIFKPPKTFNLPDWLKQEVLIARKEISGELAEIDKN